MSYYYDDTVSPLDLPDPIIGRSECINSYVESDGVEVEARVLECESGNAFEFGRLLRKSIYGEVVQGYQLLIGERFYSRSDRKVAIKIYFRSRLPGASEYRESAEDPFKEFAAMQYLQNPGCLNLVTLIECVEDANHIYFVMEFLEKELFDVVTMESVPESSAKMYFKQIVEGMEYLQSRSICHRDISLENVMLSESGRAVIIDFGMCLLLPRHVMSGEVMNVGPQGTCGKKSYMAPEIYHNSSFNGFQSDVWSLGVLLYMLLTKSAPYQYPSTMDPHFRAIALGRLPRYIRTMNVMLSPHAVDLLDKMLRVNPEDRITVSAIKTHPWLSTA